MTTPRGFRPWILVAAAIVLTACADASSLKPGMEAVEKIRGRKFDHDVKNVRIDRSDLTRHLREQMLKNTPYSIEDWGTILRSLQLVDAPAEEILPKLLSLYESQVLAFYDPYSHTYYSIKQLPKLPPEAAKIADPEMLEETVMVHELTHALQDQHFSLAKREKALMRDTDANMAYHAVLEGEGVLVMMIHMLQKMGVNVDEVMKDDTMMDSLVSAAQANTMIDPSTPPYFAEMLKFPYLDGTNFVVAAYKSGGWAAVDKLHSNPPRTTREVLHPEEYLARTFTPRPFDGTKPSGNVIAVEHLGEFHWRFLLGRGVTEGWVNDRAVIYRDGRVRVESTWETPKTAEAFANAYVEFLQKRGIEPVLSTDHATVTVEYTSPKK
jgi:hypothetical protein